MRPPHTCRVFSDFNSRLFTRFFPSLPANQLPVCVFLLAFLSENTCRVFSDFNSRLYTHFSLINLPISFRFCVFLLAFLSKKTCRVFSDFNSRLFTRFFPSLPANQLPEWVFSLFSSYTHGTFFLARFPHPTHNKTRAAVHPPSSYHFPRVQVRSSSRCSYPAPAPRIP